MKTVTEMAREAGFTSGELAFMQDQTPDSVFERNHGRGASMTKEDALKLIKLLSAMESWSFSTKTDLPDYLHEDLCLAVERLEKIVLEKP